MARVRACPRSPSPSALAAAASSLAIVGSALGCGGDQETKRGKEPPARAQTTRSAPTATAPGATAPPRGAEPPSGGSEPRGESPESQPGGAGDEEAARAPALFTGRGGRISPRVVRVPPFLAIAIEVRSADRREYALRFGAVTARSGKPGRSKSEVSGLRPGQRLVGKPVGGGPPVVIEASAEPGP